jgi:hypothetical protein
MAKQTSTKTAAPTKEFERIDSYKSIYVNTAQFGYTQWDFQVTVGQVEVSRDPKHSKPAETATISMAPQFAKALLLDFARVLSEFEAKHGAIRLSVENQKKLEAIQNMKKAGTKKTAE